VKVLFVREGQGRNHVTVGVCVGGELWSKQMLDI